MKQGYRIYGHDPKKTQITREHKALWEGFAERDEVIAECMKLKMQGCTKLVVWCYGPEGCNIGYEVTGLFE